MPAGYAAAPLVAGGGYPGPVRVCVLCRRETDAVAGRWVVVRRTEVARTLLGCLTDAAGAVIDWVELWG